MQAERQARLICADKEGLMKKRIFTLLLSLSLIIAAFPLSAFADGGAAVTVTGASASVGGYATVYISASGFKSVSGIDLTVHYDSSAMSVESAGAAALLNGVMSSIDSSVSGEVRLSAASPDGITSSDSGSYSDRLIYIRFKLREGAPVGKYRVSVTMGEVYDSALSAVAVSGGSGYITVTEKTAPKFGLYANSSSSALTVGDEWELRIRRSANGGISAADFSAEYDRDVFTLISVTLGSGLNADGALYSVNTDTAGLILISCAAEKAVVGSMLFTVKLKAISESAASAVTVAVKDAYNENREEYLPEKITLKCSVKAEDVPEDYPDLFIKSEELKIGSEALAQLCVEKGAGIAAGDFTVKYDPAVIACRGVTAADGALENGGTVVINPNFKSGTVKFSYINESGYSDTDIALVNILWEPLLSPAKHTEISASVSGAVDKNYNDIRLDYKNLTPHIYSLKLTPPSCTDGGFTEYTCGCGYSFVSDETERTGHTDTNSDIICDTCGQVITEKADINGDTDINILDLVCLKKHAAYGTAVGSGAIPDINGDGTVNSLDAAILRRFLILNK